MNELTFLSAVSMAERIRRKELSPRPSYSTPIYSASRNLNPKLNAFVHVDRAGARLQAQIAESAVAQGLPLGPLHGVPVSIKSSIDVSGMPCESGTRLRRERVAEKDAPLVSRLRQAGAIVLGVTNTPELLMAWETDNLLYGPTKNPWDLSRTPGGLERWGSSGHRFRVVRGWGGQRRRRIDSRTGSLHRHLRSQAYAGPDSGDGAFSSVRGAFRIDRRCRTDGSHCGRLESALRGHARAG